MGFTKFKYICAILLFDSKIFKNKLFGCLQIHNLEDTNLESCSDKMDREKQDGLMLKRGKTWAKNTTKNLR
jgi:hypothetical protein